MQEVRVNTQEGAFPSQGRVRFNIAHPPDLRIHEGEHVDLINEISKKTVTTSVIADDMVRKGHIRISEEDLSKRLASTMMMKFLSGKPSRYRKNPRGCGKSHYVGLKGCWQTC